MVCNDVCHDNIFGNSRWMVSIQYSMAYPF